MIRDKRMMYRTSSWFIYTEVLKNTNLSRMRLLTMITVVESFIWLVCLGLFRTDRFPDSKETAQNPNSPGIQGQNVDSKIDSLTDQLEILAWIAKNSPKPGSWNSQIPQQFSGTSHRDNVWKDRGCYFCKKPGDEDNHCVENPNLDKRWNKRIKRWNREETCWKCCKADSPKVKVDVM